jgi:hypothetical protein
MERFRVTGPSHDLLKPRNQARQALAHQLREHLGGWFIRKTTEGDPKPQWRGPMARADVMAAFDGWHLKADNFAVGRRDKTGTVALAVRVENIDVPLLLLANCSKATSECWSLVKAQFPGIVFSGGYVYKKILGTEEWSDHAWGTAFDASQSATVPNDAVIKWMAEMARAGCMAFDYALGSKDGHVVECYAPAFNIEPSGAASSHLWHTHCSVVNHHGARPPGEGGVA